ncbi:unnamed protein product [Rotaria magnacalcarata]|uniref:F-box domain-containing protein n=4 Tax=Rotaria magnacalcarata TaxID=392030 RepID=A0A819VQB0_9BILA|nr:unnamed protein product [Rotaria magnacalcarata]
MDHMKRQLSFNQLSEENTKKLRNELLDELRVSSIENLSNELFHEIFDYLDGIDIYEAFSNINYRFQQLLTSSPVLYKIELIYSLPRLFSLNIRTMHIMGNLNDIYRLIFELAALKYNKLYLYGNECSISIPLATGKQLSTIEYLEIVHYYTFDELSDLISYTPKLRHLNLSHINQDDSTIETMSPINLENLTSISMYTNYINFDEFETFIQNIYSELRTLHVTFSYQDITFLDAYRWEKLILQYLSQLKKFSLKYYDNGHSMYSGERTQFNSSFWIERKLIMNMEINEYKILYLVSPYRKRWYEDKNSTVDYLESTQLTINYVFDGEPADFLFMYIKSILNRVQIYHLDIQRKISIDRLMQIIHLLPDLITLKINSLAFYRSFFNEEFPTTCSIEHASKIKKVYIENTQTIEEVYFLLHVCPHMEFLNLQCLHGTTIELFLRDILNKINKDLRLLCIYVSKADDNMIKRLSTMIDNEKLLSNYTIHRELNDIYFQWK